MRENAAMSKAGLLVVLILAVAAGCSDGPPPPAATDIPEIANLTYPGSVLLNSEFSPESSGVGLDDRQRKCRNATSTSIYVLPNSVAAGEVLDFYDEALSAERFNSYIFNLPQTDRIDRLWVIANVSTFENGVEHFEGVTGDNESVLIRKYKVLYEVGFDSGGCKTGASNAP